MHSNEEFNYFSTSLDHYQKLLLKFRSILIQAVLKFNVIINLNAFVIGDFQYLEGFYP